MSQQNKSRRILPVEDVETSQEASRMTPEDLGSNVSHSIHQPKARIVIQNFCDESNKTFFGIKRFGEDTIEFFTASEISLDKDLLNSLHPQAAHLIGYAMANDKALEDQEMMAQLIEDEQSKTV